MTSSTFAASPVEDGPVGAEVAASLQQALASLEARMNADLQARIDERMARVLDQPTESQIASMLRELDPQNELASRIDARTEGDLATLTRQVGASSLASARGERSEVAREPAPPTLRMDTGYLALASRTLKEAQDHIARRRQHFERPFSQAPQVAVGVRILHLSGAEQPRVAVRVVSVDAAGFDYEVRASGDARPADLRADWVAYSDPSQSPTQAAMVPASRR